GAVAAKGGPRFARWGVAVAGDAGRTARRLRDHVEGEVSLVRAAGAEALDLAIDDPWVQLLDHVVAEPQPLDRAGRHILDGHVGFLEQGLDDLEGARRFEVEGYRFLVGVELVEVPGVVVGLTGPLPPAGIAGHRLFDLAHLCDERGRRLAGWSA